MMSHRIDRVMYFSPPSFEGKSGGHTTEWKRE